MPLRMPCANGLAFHPSGKAFIEPDIVPPRGGHKIAKPLMRDLMRNDGGVPLLAENRGGLLIHEQRSIAIENGSSVLHAAPLIVRDGQHVELFKWILDAIPLVIEVDRLRGSFQSELAVLFFAWL